MTAMQINAELFQSLSVMTKNEFFAKVDEALEQARRGEGKRFDNKEEMNAWLNSL